MLRSWYHCIERCSQIAEQYIAIMRFLLGGNFDITSY